MRQNRGGGTVAKPKKPSATAQKKSGTGRKGVTLPDIPPSVADATSTAKTTSTDIPASVVGAAKAKVDDGRVAAAKSSAPKVAEAKPVESKAAKVTKPVPSEKAEKLKTKAQSETQKVSEPKKVEPTKPVETKPVGKKVEETRMTQPEIVKSTPTPVVEERRSTFLPVALGVGGAAVLGFLTSEFNWFGLRNDAGNTDFAAEISRQQEQIDALTAAQDAMEVPDISGITQDVGTLSTTVETLKSDIGAQISGMTDTLGGFEDRIAEVEKRPITGDSDAGKEAFAFFENKFTDLTASVEAQSADLAAKFEGLEASVQEQGASVVAQKEVIDGLVADAKSAEEAAEEAAKVANIQLAVAKITAAVNEGAPFAPALAELQAAGATDIPAVLAENAEAGVPSVDVLKAQFPAAANAALQVARVVAPSEEEAGVGGFLKRQLGARSVVPREGNSADAVLSRAEEAVRNGALNDAFSEIEALPPEAQEKLQDWLAAAQARQAAETAVQDLSQSLMAN